MEQRCSRQRQLAFALRKSPSMQSLVLDALAVLEDYLFELTIAQDEEMRLP